MVAKRKSARIAKRVGKGQDSGTVGVSSTAGKGRTAGGSKPRVRTGKISRKAAAGPSADRDRGPRHEPSGISNRAIGEERARQALVPPRQTRKDPEETAKAATAGESKPPHEGQNDREEVAAEHSPWMAEPDAPFRRARRPAGGGARLGIGRT